MKKPPWTYQRLKVGGCWVRLASWQTEPFTEKALRQLHEQPKVIVERESVIRRAPADHSVPDLSNVASYVECGDLLTEDFHTSPRRHAHIEDELTRMFSNDREPEDSIAVDKPPQTKRKARTLKELLVDLFGSPLDDLDEPPPPKRIRSRRRHTLPVSLTVDPETLQPLRISHKRRSEEARFRLQEAQVAVLGPFTRAAELVVPPVFSETARPTYSDHELETAFVTEPPVVAMAETAAAFIDLTADDETTVMHFGGIRVEVKGEHLRACAPSMPLLSPVSPAEPTRAEEVLPPPDRPRTALEAFGIVEPRPARPKEAFGIVDPPPMRPKAALEAFGIFEPPPARPKAAKPQGQKRTGAEKAEGPARRRRATDKTKTKTRTIAPAPPPPAPQPQNPPPDARIPNHSVLQDLMHWEAAKKRAMLQTQAQQRYAPNGLTFRVPEQWQWPMGGQMVQRANPESIPMIQRANPDPNQMMQRANPDPLQMMHRANPDPSMPRLTRLLIAPREYTLVSNSVCAEKLYPHVNKFVHWRSDALQFHEKTTAYLTLVDRKDCDAYFKRYSQAVRLVLSRNMIRDFSGIDVRDFNMHEVVTYLSVRVIVNGCSVSVYRICNSIFTMLAPVETECNTPFLRRLFNNAKACAMKMEERWRQGQTSQGTCAPVPLFTEEELQRLETQIRQCNHIQNWLNAKLSLRVQKKQPPPYSLHQGTARTQRSIASMERQLQETVARLQHENALYSANNQRVPQTGTESANCRSEPPALTQEAQPTCAQAQEPAAQTQPTCAQAQGGTSESAIIETGTTVESETPVVQGSTEVPSPHKNSPAIEEPACNKEELDIVANEVSGVKSETRKEDEVIDLTWIEDGDEKEILEEVIECKNFPFKVENYEDGAAREVVSPTDSGLGSPVAVQSDGEEYKCLCGNKAIYVCACNSSMYCSSECQNRDWVYHQKLCHKLKS